MIGITSLFHTEAIVLENGFATRLMISTAAIVRLQYGCNLRGGFVDLKVKIANFGSNPSKLL